MSSGALGLRPTTWREFLLDIGENRLKKFPTRQQTGHNCFAYAPRIAMTLSSGGSVIPDVTCFEKNYGGLISTTVEYLNDKYQIQGTSVTSKTIHCSDPSDSDFVECVMNPLRENLLVLGILRSGYPEFVEDHIEFNYNNNDDGHAMCVIGCYDDNAMGPCLVTKTSNYPAQTIEKRIVICKPGTMIFDTDVKYQGYGLIPLETWLCSNVIFSDNNFVSGEKYEQTILQIYKYPKPVWKTYKF